MKKKKLTGQRLKLVIIGFAVNIVVTIVFGLITALIPEANMEVGGRFALATANIIIAISVLQLSLSLNFENSSEDAKESVGIVLSKLNELSLKIDVVETVKKALEADANLQQFIMPMFESSHNQIKKYLEEQRTGALASPIYYTELLKLSDRISTEKKEMKRAFSGEIWAQSSLLELELDTSDAFESVWCEKMKELDKQEIPTRRLYIVKPDDMALLKSEELTPHILTQLEKLLPYCIQNSEFSNTISKAISQDRIDPSDALLLGPGFFAVTFSDDISTMIRDVSIDNQQSGMLGGEVDFNVERVKRAKGSWENYMSLALPLKQFLQNNCSRIVKAKMIEMGFDIQERNG